MNTSVKNPSRRKFIKTSATVAGGLVIGFNMPMGGRMAKAASNAGQINAWLRIAPDNSVTILVAASEMGQGVFTAMPMLVAEELELDWKQVHAEMAPAAPDFINPIFNMQATGGSTSIRGGYGLLRPVGASAREMLRQAAAKQWDVPVEECSASMGTIVHAASNRSATYGELAEAAAQETPPADIPLKEPGDWKILGKPTPRLDTPMKVNGTAGFGIDVQVPGMLVGTVAASPVFGGKLKSVNEAPAMIIDGVHQVVSLDNAVVVLADSYWPAKQGLAALKPVWDEGEHAGLNSKDIQASFLAALDEEGAVAHSEGDVAAAMAGASKVLEADYQAPYLAHATMEPMNATAHVTDEGIEVWAPTQAQGPIQGALSQIMGVKPEQVQVHTTFLGGGFGRRFEIDFVLYAVLASKAAGFPVKLVWSREEDTQHDFYRPAAAARFKAALGEDGLPVALATRVVCPSIMTRVFPGFVKDGIDSTAVEGTEKLFYSIPNQHADYVMKHTGVPVGFWRSVGHSQNAFFVQSFVDEMANASGIDALEYQRNLMANHPRHKAVLEKAADMAGWGTPAAEGRYRGLAIHESFGSIVAEVAEVSVSSDGSIRVHNVACAVDCGLAMNPSTVTAQMESGIVYGLTAALYGEIDVESGRAKQSNFDTYRMLKMSEMPSIQIEIIQSGAAVGGIGEPATPPIAPAVANAVFAATGKRLRSLPLRIS